MDNAETQFLRHQLGGNRIPKNCVIEQIWGDHDNGTSGTQTTGDLGKCFRRVIEVLDDHPTGDQIEGIVREGHVVERPLNE